MPDNLLFINEIKAITKVLRKKIIFFLIFYFGLKSVRFGISWEKKRFLTKYRASWMLILCFLKKLIVSGPSNIIIVPTLTVGLYNQVSMKIIFIYSVFSVFINFFLIQTLQWVIFSEELGVIIIISIFRSYRWVGPVVTSFLNGLSSKMAQFCG